MWAYVTPIYQLSCQEFERIQDKSVVLLQVIQCTFCLFCFSPSPPPFCFTATLFYLVSSSEETMAIKKKVTCKTSFSWNNRRKTIKIEKKSVKIVYALDQIRVKPIHWLCNFTFIDYYQLYRKIPPIVCKKK